MSSSRESSQNRRRSMNSPSFIRSYDHASPVHSPKTSPGPSRKNSTTSVTSNDKTTPPSSRRNSFLGLFSKKDKKEEPMQVLTSKHAAAAQVHMNTDKNYTEYKKSHTPQPQNDSKSSHSTGYLQEMRHPHSGPPAIHTDLSLTKIDDGEEQPESDGELDEIEKLRKQWNTAPEHNTSEIENIIARSRPSSRRGTPSQSREVSPSGAYDRIGLGSRQGSYTSLSAGNSVVGLSGKKGYTSAYQRDENGKWFKKEARERITPPRSVSARGTTLNGNDVLDTLAEDLRERLKGVV